MAIERTSHDYEEKEADHLPPFSFKKFLSYSGPGCLIAIAYLDPGNLEADLQAGSYTKYKLAWVLFYSLVVGYFLQGLCIRIAVYTGRHLSQLCREEYSHSVALLIWICSEISIITCDMQAIITSAVALNILFQIPLWAGCLLTFADVFTFIILELRNWHSIDHVFVFLVSMMAICFFWNFGLNPPNAADVIFGSFAPSLHRSSFPPAVGLIGSIILPQNFFIHSGLVLKAKVDRRNKSELYEAEKYMLVDTAFALIVAFLINLAVISSFAEIFYSPDCSLTSACIESIGDSANSGFCENGNGAEGKCGKIGLSDAGFALAGALGSTASIIWAVGLLASCQSSTMTITYAGQFLLDGFFEIKLPLYIRVLFCRLVALIPAVIAALLSTTNPTQLDDVTEWGNIVASICVPMSVIPLLKFSGSSKLMGENAIGLIPRLFGWLVVLFLVFTNVYLMWIYTIPSTEANETLAFCVVILSIFSCAYGCCIYICGYDDFENLVFSIVQWPVFLSACTCSSDNTSTTSLLGKNTSSSSMLSPQSIDIDESEDAVAL